ncbi:RANGRF [Bugula neritina]|uniref:RANGRF n=1 Tax=Bugula neritina TaxID=10212 RepID=A0A7J7JT87_BUGNE|nr:RANGRF [Bugula neritina]KAF6029579.1 RANGRF [Bugula neritina]
MEYTQAEDDIQAIRTYFEDLAESNAAQFDASTLSYDCLDLSSLSATQCKSCQMVTGVQNVYKFKDVEANVVEIHMALLRLPQFTTDILITFNNTLHISEGSSSQLAESSSSQAAWTHQDFLALVQSLVIVNESLFG